MKKIIIIITIFIISAAIIHPTYAQQGSATNGSGPQGSATNGPAPGTQTSQNLPKLQNPLKVGSIQGVIYLAVDLAIYIGTAFAILALIFVGFKFVEARGNDVKLKAAKQWFFYVIIGFAILISAKVIVEIVKNTLVQSGVVNEDVWGNSRTSGSNAIYDYNPNNQNIINTTPPNPQTPPSTLPDTGPTEITT